MSEELKPCPFCGGETFSMRILGDRTLVECQQCRATLIVRGNCKKTAKHWNHRPSECDFMKEELDIFKAENKEILDILDRLVNFTDYASLSGAVHDAKEALKKARGEE